MMVGVLLFVAAVMLAALVVSRRRHSYWSSRGVPTPPFLPFLGHTHKLLSRSQHRWMYFNEVYYKHGGATFCGLYELLSPVLMIGDPDLVKHVFVKDFDHFVDRRVVVSGDENILSDMLSNKTGEEWKGLRSVITPTFTLGKMRSMFPLVCDKADALVSFSLKEAAQKPFVDMKHNFGRFTIDAIASCAFGIESNSLVDEEAQFAKIAESFFDLSFLKILKSTLPSLYKALRLKTDTSHIKFFQSVIDETMAARKTGHRRGDFLDLLLDMQADQNHRTATNHATATHSQSSTSYSNLTATVNHNDLTDNHINGFTDNHKSLTDNHKGLSAADNQHLITKSKPS